MTLMEIINQKFKTSGARTQSGDCHGDCLPSVCVAVKTVSVVLRIAVRTGRVRQYSCSRLFRVLTSAKCDQVIVGGYVHVPMHVPQGTRTYTRGFHKAHVPDVP